MRVCCGTHSPLPTMVLTNRFKGSGIHLSQLRWGAPLLYVLAMNLRPALDVTFIEAHRRVRPVVTFACIASIRITPRRATHSKTLLAGRAILQFNALRVKEVDYMLETERLTLRAWSETDAESLYAYAKDPDIGPIAGWPAHRSKEESLNTIRHVLNGKECYAICERGSNDPIGSIELKLNGHTDMTDRDDECELGYWLGKPFWGRGYMPEAAKEIIRHGFVDLGMSAIWCGYYDGNLKSKRVQEKVGFVYHHTCDEVSVPLMHEVRVGHVNILTKSRWQTLAAR